MIGGKLAEVNLERDGDRNRRARRPDDSASEIELCRGGHAPSPSAEFEVNDGSVTTIRLRQFGMELAAAAAAAAIVVVGSEGSQCECGDGIALGVRPATA